MHLTHLVTMLERTGKSAITAVVMTELFSLTPPADADDEEEDALAVEARPPPVTGFRPRIHTKCCKVCMKARISILSS